jgi:DNA-binding GntR family transcriptional regulator
MDAIAARMFEFLWGSDHEPIPTAVDHAFESIWRQLIVGVRKPGERLSDVELAAQLGVSRTPVRQALHRLAQDELVLFDPRRGFRVRAFSAQDVHELYDVRAALEVLAIRQAVPKLRRAELIAQLDLHNAMRDRLAEKPIVPWLQIDFGLHNLVIHASENGRLIRLLAALRSQVCIFQIRDAEYPNRLEMALDGHLLIIQALIDLNTDLAASLLAEHIHIAKLGVLSDMFAGSKLSGDAHLPG